MSEKIRTLELARLYERQGYYEDALENYKNMNWSKSLELFSEVLNQKNNDITIKKYIQRCKNYISNPPAENWSYIIELKEK